MKRLNDIEVSRHVAALDGRETMPLPQDVL
jgi:hypothetical protein